MRALKLLRGGCISLDPRDETHQGMLINFLD